MEKKNNLNKSMDSQLRRSIRLAIDSLFERAKARLLGRFYNGPKIFFQIVRDFGLDYTLEAAHRHAAYMGTGVGTDIDRNILETQAEETDSIIESLKTKTFKEVFHAAKLGDVDKIKEIFESVESHMDMIVATESRKAQALGEEDAIMQVAASKGIEDPTIFWIGRLDEKTCLEENELVHTKDGLKPIKDLKIGDKLLKPAQIKSINPRRHSLNDQYFSTVRYLKTKQKEVFEFTFNDGTTIRCTNDHPILVKVKNKYLFWEIGKIPEDSNIEIINISHISGAELKKANYQINMTNTPFKSFHSDIWDFTQDNRELIIQEYKTHKNIENIIRSLEAKYKLSHRTLGTKFKETIKGILILAGEYKSHLPLKLNHSNKRNRLAKTQKNKIKVNYKLNNKTPIDSNFKDFVIGQYCKNNAYRILKVVLKGVYYWVITPLSYFITNFKVKFL